MNGEILSIESASKLARLKQKDKMKEDLLNIINHYGVLNQLKYIHSEYFELDEAIFDCEYDSENWNDDYLKKHITEELADVMVMLKQFQYYYGIESENIEEVMKNKIKRQLNRIEED